MPTSTWKQQKSGYRHLLYPAKGPSDIAQVEGQGLRRGRFVATSFYIAIMEGAKVVAAPTSTYFVSWDDSRIDTTAP